MIWKVLFTDLLLGLTAVSSVRRLDDYGNSGYEYGVKHPSGNSRVVVLTGNGHRNENNFYKRGHNEPHSNYYSSRPYHQGSYGTHLRDYENERPYSAQIEPSYEEHFNYPQSAPNHPHNLYNRNRHAAYPSNYDISGEYADFPFHDGRENKNIYPTNYHNQPKIHQEKVPIEDFSTSYYPDKYISHSPLGSKQSDNYGFSKHPVEKAFLTYDQPSIVQQDEAEESLHDLKNNNYKNHDGSLTQLVIDDEINHNIKSPPIQQQSLVDIKLPTNPKIHHNQELLNFEPKEQQVEEVDISQHPIPNSGSLSIKNPEYADTPKIGTPVVQKNVGEDNIKNPDVLIQAQVPVDSKLGYDDLPSSEFLQKPIDSISQSPLDTKPFFKEQTEYPFTKNVLPKKELPVIQQEHTDYFPQVPAPVEEISHITDARTKHPGNFAAPIIHTDFDDNPSQAVYDSPVEPSFSDFDDHGRGHSVLTKPGYQYIPSFPSYEKTSHTTDIVHPPPRSHKILPPRQEELSDFPFQTNKNIPQTIKSVASPHSIKQPPVKYFGPDSESVKYPQSNSYSFKKPIQNHDSKLSFPVPTLVKHPHYIKHATPFSPSIKYPNAIHPTVKYAAPPVEVPYQNQPSIKTPSSVQHSIKSNNIPSSIKQSFPAPYSVKTSNPVSPLMKYPPAIGFLHHKVPVPSFTLHGKQNKINHVPPSIKAPPLSHSIKSSITPFSGKSSPLEKYPPPIGLLHHKVPIATFPPKIEQSGIHHDSLSVKTLPAPHSVKTSDNTHSTKSGPSYSVKTAQNPYSIKRAYVSKHLKSPPPPPPFFQQNADIEPQLEHTPYADVPLNEHSVEHNVQPPYLDAPKEITLPRAELDLTHPHDEEIIQKSPPVSHAVRLPLPLKPLNQDSHSDDNSDNDSPVVKPKPHAVILPNSEPNLSVTTVPNLFAAVPQPISASYTGSEETSLNKPPPISHAHRLLSPTSHPAESPKAEAYVSGEINPHNDIPSELKNSPISHSMGIPIPSSRGAEAPRSFSPNQNPSNAINPFYDYDESVVHRPDFPAFPPSAFTQDDPVADKVSELTRSYLPARSREPEDDSPSTNEAKRQIDRLNEEISGSFGDRLPRRSSPSRTF